MTDNIYSAYHYACKTKKDREDVEQMKADTLEAAQKAVWGNVGDVKYTTRTTAPNGGVWCDGGTYDKSSFETVYQMLVDGKLQAVTMDVYDSTVSTNKSCGFFGLDTVNEVFKVPTLTDVYLKAGQAAQTFGAESLPQHTHTGTVALQGTFDNYNTGYYNQFAGADYSSGRGTGTLKTGGASSGVYKDSAKVNPDHVKYRAYIILCTVVKDVSIGDYTNILANATREGVDTLNAKTLSGISDLANASNALRTTQITNCITEIPQDIKLELNNGVLTLKAGSKVYIPNGFEADGVTPKFDMVVIESDKSMTTAGYTNKAHIFYNHKRGWLHDEVRTESGSSVTPTQEYVTRYDTTVNTIFRTIDGVSWSENYQDSLSLAIVSVNNTSGITSIDQVFNGFGYIGSTVFALPGVKGLIPNGRNADGSLKNVEFTTGKVLTYTYSVTLNNANMNIIADSGKPTGLNYRAINGTQTSGWYHDEEKNIYTYNGSVKLWVDYGTISTSAGVITSFTPKLPFRAVDYNDKAEVISWMMPNYGARVSRTKDTKYKAEVSGYLIGYDLLDRTNGASAYIYINDINVRINSAQDDYAKNSWCYPILKGSSYYFTGTSTMGMYFVPCIGG